MDKISRIKIKVTKENSVKLLLASMYYGTDDLNALYQKYNDNLVLNFIDIKLNDKTRKEFIDQYVNIFKDKVINSKYSTSIEALFSCIKKLFYSEATKNNLINYLNDKNKLPEKDLVEYLVGNFILYSYSAIDSLAYFINGYLNLRLPQDQCDLIRECFLSKISISNIDIYKEILKFKEELYILKKFRNNLSHKFTFIAFLKEEDKKRYIFKDPNINFSQISSIKIKNEEEITHFLEEKSKIIQNLIKNLLGIIF